MKAILKSSVLLLSLLTGFCTNAQTVSYSDLYTNSTFNRSDVDLTSKPVGSTPGVAGTSPTGAATYTIPILCPSGTNGMVPNLSIVYNSQGGNGILGQGWNLTGLSAITRAGWDTYHYGKVAPISYQSLAPYLVPTSGGSAYVFEKSDAFVLDGSYLYPKSGTYGASGSTYLTEAESYSVTTSNGSVGGGPDYFTVVSKDGTTMEFGRSATSKFYTDDFTKVMMWRISKIIDPNGNYIEFIYDTTERESRIVKIKYTGHTSGMLPYNEVNFYYSERSDKNTLYDGGYTMKSKYLLWQIQVVAESETFKTYQFNFGKNETGISYMKSVFETASDGSTVNDTRFKYGEKTNDFIETVSTDPIFSIDATQMSTGDFDGDGLADFLVYEYALAPGTAKVYNTNLTIKKRSASSTTYTNAGNKTFSGVGVRVENALKQFFFTQRKIIPQFSDFNGDGRDDIIISNYNTSPIIGGGYVNSLDYIHIFYTNADATLPSSPNFIYTPPSIYTAILKGSESQENYLQIGDFDGDGSADFITMLSGAIYFHSPRRGIANKPISQLNLNSGSIPSAAMSWVFDLYFRQADDIFVVNMDGDAKSDLMVVTNGTTRIFTLNFDAVMNDLHMNQIGEDMNYPTNGHDINFGDFNGDGKTDILTGIKASSSINWILGYSNGRNFIQKPFVFDFPLNIGTLRVIVNDFNGDGKSDILKQDDLRNSLYLSTGKSFSYKFYLSPYYLSSEKDFYAVGDFNGDAKCEVYYPAIHDASDLSCRLFFSFNPFDNSHLLSKISDGFNRTTEFTYEPLTKGTGTGAGDFYTKGSGETYPINNVQFPLYVATSMKTPDGVGGLNTTYFGYTNLRLHRGGRGLLGFEQVKSYNVNADIRTETNFGLNKTFYIPYLKNTKTFLKSTGLQLTQTDNTVDFISKPSTFYPSYTYTGILRPGANVGYKQEQTETLVKDLLQGVTTTTTNTFDSDGNVTYSISTTTGGETLVSMSTNTFIKTGGSSFFNRPSLSVSTSKRGSQPTVSTEKAFSYDGKGRPISIVSKPTGGIFSTELTETMAYDVFGNLVHTTTHQHYSSTIPYKHFEYDDYGRFVKNEENTFGVQTKYTTHKFWGKPLTVKGVNGLTTTYTYDSWGKLKTSTVPTSSSASYTINYSDGWDIATNLLYYTLTQDTSAPDVKTWYDHQGRVKKTIKETFGGAWTKTYTNYDAKGNVASSTNFHLDTETPQTTTNTYDEYNRIWKTYSISGTTEYSYVLGGGYTNTTVKLPDGTIKKTKSDATGKIIESTNGNAGTVVFEYDSWGNEISTKLKGAFGPITTQISKKYDALGNLEEMDDKDAGITRYNYDRRGRLIRFTSPNSVLTQYHYDIADRLEKKELSKGGALYKYEYKYFGADKDYRLKEAKVDGPDGIVTEYFDYYVGGGVNTYFKDIKGTIFAKTYTYDAYNRLLSSTDNTHVTLASGGVFYCAGSGFGTVNEYDANGFLKKISSNTTPSKILYEATAMNGSEQITVFKRPGGLNSIINYTNNLPTYFTTGTIQDLHTNFDYTNGNVLNRSEETLFAPKPEESFTYDAIDRLTKSDVAVTISGVTGPVTTHSIVNTDYDKFMTVGTCPSCYGTLSYGRLVSKSDVGNYIYSGFPANAVKEIVISPGSSVISHETQNIVYNLFDKTQTITEKIGSNHYEEKMVYDASEDRAYTQQSQGSSTTALGVARQRWYVGDYEKQVIAGNTQHIHYINCDAGIVAMVVKDASGYHYYPVFTDHLGSIVKVTDELGVTVAEQNFDAWGRERNPAYWDYDMTGTFVKPTWLYRGYTGHEMLPEYGLINMNGRMYDPANGRMLRPDNNISFPENTQGYNRYSYAMNNPLKYTDPDGQWVHIVVGAVIGGLVNVAMHSGRMHSARDFAVAFGIGAVAGGVAAATGGASLAAGGAATSVAGATGIGAISGGMGYLASAPILLTGNSIYFQDPYPTGKEIATQFAVSVATAGLLNGTQAALQGLPFWTPPKPTTYNYTISAGEDISEASLRYRKSIGKGELNEVVVKGQAKTTMIGHFKDDYVKTATQNGYNYYISPDGNYCQPANQLFLDDAIIRGDKFIISRDFDLIRKSSILEWEVNYLINNGYKQVSPTMLIPN